MNAIRQPLPGQRWHFQHGPIDLVIGAEAELSGAHDADADTDADADAEAAVAASHEAAWERFQHLLAELVGELGRLKDPIDVSAVECPVRGPVARRMWHACFPYRSGFITPMAAVAGSVAQEIVACYVRRGVARAWVNNGGDIALHLAQRRSVRIGVYADLATFDALAASKAIDPDRHGALQTDAFVDVRADMPVRGVATSGWRGRSFSLGIADSVTVLAATAAEADAAATVVANAVDVADPRIERARACDLREDSDLGAMLVTTGVPRLAPMLVARALDAGLLVAERLRSERRLFGAAVLCQGQTRTVGSVLAS